ncbi:hypothetical protein ACFX2J_034182 [Malus domestica]
MNDCVSYLCQGKLLSVPKQQYSEAVCGNTNTIFDFWNKVELILALRRHFLEAGRVKGVAGKYGLGTRFHIFSIEELEFPDISCIVLDS